ncbi:hypothetical protein V2J09_019666 [Rumex salicifolius]
MSTDNVSVSQSTSSRSLFTAADPSDEESAAVFRPGIDLVAAARRNVTFLRNVADSDWLHHSPTLLESIRRYEKLWMPLISDLTVNTAPPPVLVPPFDIEWVWFCHSLDPIHYREYCLSRFSKIIGKPAIFDRENEDYAFSRCSQIWSSRYPNEPFDNESDPEIQDPDAADLQKDLIALVLKKRILVSLFLEAYMSETLYLMAARRRYNKLLSLLISSSDMCSCLVPTVDILLIWITHMSYPTVYAADTKHMEDALVKVVGPWEKVGEEDVEESKKLWQSTFDQPYEKAGANIPSDFGDSDQVKLLPVYWVASDSEDVNTKYKSMHPRFLLEVCVHVRILQEMEVTQTEKIHDFLRLSVLKCHRELKHDIPFSVFSRNTWQKAWHLYCEFGTKGIKLDLKHPGSLCFKGTGLLESASFQWNSLLRAPSLALTGELDQRVKSFTSITPPVQAPYLLKCVPDCVTDDSGAMISDLILRMNQYRPQEGRWLSRTVLDHTGRECFVIRIRIGGGFWRRGGEAPKIVNWEDRIIEVREGSWSYVADSVGKAPEKVVGQATPKEESLQERRASWSFSNGDELTIQWDSTATFSSLSFSLNNQNSSKSSPKLLMGRRMQYETAKEAQEHNREEEHFVTLVRYTDENPTGKATALINWKLQVVEILPEEDAVFVLLLCLAIVRSISEIKREDVGNLLVRKRLKETKPGSKDWGSIMLHPSTSLSFAPSVSGSPHLKPWYWGGNANVVFAREVDRAVKQPVLPFSLVEGGDKLYKKGIIS